MATLYIDKSVRKIKFFENFACVGFDYEKVRLGIEDLTEISEVDKSRNNWNKGIYACQIHYYTQEKNENFYRKINEDVCLFEEIS